ncbi:disease resistance protein At4g27190-like isoform X2 [Euphorbia lathyris]
MDPLTDLGIVVATEATTSLLAKIKKHNGFLYKYKENIKGLEVAEEKLDAKRTDASRFTEDTKRKQKDVSSTAAHWQSEADHLHQNAQKIISGNNISCLHPWSRYSTSKHAWELAHEINQKVQTAPDFGTAFDRPTPKLGAKFDLTGFTEFESRSSVVNQVWEALKDERVRMCSLCGMGGTGKTTLAKKLIQRVETDHLFDKVAMATVSQNPDLRKIRSDIMSSLGLNFESRELETSDKLNDCLMNSGSILLIVDDVWEVLDFEALGLPKARLKILLTSRKIDVCQRMGSQPNIVINVLTDEEAWGLFKEITVESIEKWKLHDTARKIADECGGLPMVIVTLAGALKYEIKATWNDSLVKLQKLTPLGISEVDQVYSRIQLSYDLLNDQEAQSCFRLCCLFPEDHNVVVEHLVWFGKGLQLFEKVESMKEARDRVGSKIDKLKKSFLLLDGEEDGTVKMHDILRDFAISISSKDKHPYIVGCEKVMQMWPETGQYENCSAISFMCDKINKHPVDLRCPKLELLQLILDDDQVGLPIGIFEGLKELKVLCLQAPSSVSQSLSMLSKLRTLIIYEQSYNSNENEALKIGDLLGHGDMKYLEILNLSILRQYDDFPVEIGLLCNLRCLRISGPGFKYMAPGVLSNLVKLEELEMPLKFDSLGCKEAGGERVNASLDELESLPLTTLEMNLARSSILAEKLVKNLTVFRISMGIHCRLYNSSASLNVANVDACDLTVSWISCLMSKCESLELSNVSSLKNIMCLQSSEDYGFPKLKDIRIYECREMEYLVDTTAERIPSTFFSELKTLTILNMDNLKEIWHGPYFSKIEVPCFSNLSEIEIKACPKLKHLFALSVARELRQLQHISILHCEMKEILYRDEVEDGNQVTSSVQLSTPTVETTSTPTILNPSNIDDKKQHICPTPNSLVQCLRGRLEKQPKMVSSTKIMEENIAKVDEKEADDSIIFPQLKSLILGDMVNLRILYDGNEAIELPSLEELRIDSCHKMKAFSYGSLSAPRLKHVAINDINYPAGEDLNAIWMKTEI